MSKISVMDDEEDPVIEEIPVLLSTKLADKLFLFQYPLRQALEGYDNATFLKTSIKPDNQEVKIEVAIETRGSHYNYSKGEALASNADSSKLGEEEDENQIFDSNMMDKLILHSSRAIPSCDNFAIGIFQDGELHITPLKGIVQMRPQFAYLDKNDKKTKDDAKNVDEMEEEEEPAKQVNVTFARQVPDFIKKMREQSFQRQSQKVSEEQWIDTDYISTTSTQAELTRLEMLCSASENSVNALNLPSDQYLSLLAPPLKEEEFSKANLPNHVTSLNYIRTLPLLDQVRILMKDAKVMSFVQLRSILSTEYDTSNVLKYLQQVAVLVQGNWIVNSELIYPRDSISAHSGIPAELMCRARDYILLMYTEHEYIDRKGISSVIKLPSEEIREIFMNLCKHHPKKGWKLIVPPSTDFLERYPEIAQRQELYWEAKRKHLREVMEAHKTTPPQRQRRRSNRESIGSENEEKNAGRGKKSFRDSSDNDSATDNMKSKKVNRSKKVSECT